MRLKAIWAVLGPFERLVGAEPLELAVRRAENADLDCARMESDPVSAGLDDPQRIEMARRVLAEARGDALDRLAALSARLLGAAHGQVSIVTDEPVA